MSLSGFYISGTRLGSRRAEVCCIRMGAAARDGPEGVYFVHALDARGPRAPPELSAIVAFCFIVSGRNKLSSFASRPRGISSVIPGQRLVGFRDVT
jgi:hypothetical protein